MATRYYPTRFSPSLRVGDVAPIVNGAWEHGDIQTYRPSGIFRIKTSKADGGLRLPAEFRCNRQGNYDFPFVRFMTPPLQAQTISGTFDLAFLILQRWSDGVDVTNDAKLRWKLHIYIAVGESTTVRHTLLANHIDSVDWPNPSVVWTGLTAPVALTSGSAVAGDVIVIELGMRIVSAPASVIGYPAESFAIAFVTGFGTTDTSNVELPDAVQGTSTAGRCPWFEFSATITEAAGSSPPSNELCANAISIPSLPFTSPFIDTTGSTDPGVSGGGRAAYWVWTAEKTGKAFFATYGSNYTTQISIATGSCGSLVIVNPTSYTRDSGIPGGRSMSSAGADVTEGVTYHIIVEHNAGFFAEHAATGGGACRLIGFYRDVPVEDDLYLVAWDIVALRESGGVVSPVNLGAALQGLDPSGIGIDYTKRPMVPISGDNPNPHVSDRLLVSLFSSDLVEILDLQTLSWAPSINEIDFIGAPYVGADNPAQLHLTHAGFLWQGFFGNGFNLVVGAGALPALLDVVSSPLDAGTLYGVEATSGDSQAGAPFTARKLDSPHPVTEITAPWAITIDEATNTLYYTSGGFYDPLSGEHPTRDSTVATIIKRYDLTNNAQLADFATVTPQAGQNPGLKGMRFIPIDGGLLACNSTQVIRFNRFGGVVRIYTPSNGQDSQSLVDVVLTANQQSFWVLDEATAHVFKFNLATGVEEADFPTYLIPGSTVQMQIYQPAVLTTPPPPCPVPDGTTLS